MSREDRPRKSWREIDRSRDGGGAAPKPAPQKAREEERAQKQYRAALEEAFARGELGKLAEKLMPAGHRGPVQDKEPEPAAPAPAPAAPPMKKKPDDKLTLRKRVVEAIGRQEITRAVEKYLERFPLPDDHEFLEQLLEHEQEGRVQEAMARIGALLEQRVLPKRSRALCGKLRYLAETSVNEKLRQDAEGLLKRIG